MIEFNYSHIIYYITKAMEDNNSFEQDGLFVDLYANWVEFDNYYKSTFSVKL